MRPFALVFLFVMTFGSAVAARMNADADLCVPGKLRHSEAATAGEGEIKRLSSQIETPQAQAALGNALHQRGRFYKAKRDWLQAIRDFDEAEAEFERSGYPVSGFSRPGYPSSRALLLTDRGAAYREIGEYAKSQHDLDAALRDSPSFSRAHIERGLTNFRAGRNDRAIEDFNHVIVNDFNLWGDDRTRAYGLRASAWLDKGEDNHANVDTKSADALSYSRCDDVKDNFCWLYALRGGPLEEIKTGDALTKYWRGEPALAGNCSSDVTDRPNLLDSLALTYLQLGELADARASAEGAIRADPGDGEKHYMLAMIKEAAGQDADAEFARARELGKPGDWERWERQQGKFRKLNPPETVGHAAARVVDESFAVLNRKYEYFALDRPVPGRSEVLENPSSKGPFLELFRKEYLRSAVGVARPDPTKWPLRVAVLAFEDSTQESPPNCRSDIVGSIPSSLARFNRAIGRTVFAMGTPEKHDILFVIGGPQSVPDLKVDPAAQEVLDAEARQTVEPNEERFVSFSPPHFTPTEAAKLYYRKSDGELIYGSIARSWGSVSKHCSLDIVGNLALAMAEGNRLKLIWSSHAASEKFDLPQNTGFVSQEIEACHLLMDPTATRDQRVDCVRTLATRDREK